MSLATNNYHHMQRSTELDAMNTPEPSTDQSKLIVLAPIIMAKTALQECLALLPNVIDRTISSQYSENILVLQIKAHTSKITYDMTSSVSLITSPSCYD
jgi:hypothetical protein